MAEMPARPSMAAAVEPARPPPMIAITVYFMGWSRLETRHHGPGKGNKPLASRLTSDRTFRHIARIKTGIDRPAAGHSLLSTAIASHCRVPIPQAPEPLPTLSFRLDLTI